MSMLTKHFKLANFTILIIEVPYEIQSSREMLPLITTAVSIIVIVGYAQKQSIKIACFTVFGIFITICTDGNLAQKQCNCAKAWVLNEYIIKNIYKIQMNMNI